MLLTKQTNTLEKLISFSGNLTEISNELSKLDWDYEGTPYIISAKQISTILHRFIIGELTSNDIENWANLIECREDIEFEASKEDIIAEIIYKLANPELEDKITSDLCKKFLNQLN